MSQIRPYVRSPLATPPVKTVSRYCLTINGLTIGGVGSEGQQRAALISETMRLMRDGWQVRRFTPDFAQVWRHSPGEMRELRVERRVS